MKIKQKSLLVASLMVLSTALGVTLFRGDSVSAYSCATSGDNGGSTVLLDGKPRQLFYQDGGCHAMVLSNKVPKTVTYDSNGNKTSSCTSSQEPSSDGECYNFQRRTTSNKPTLNDGTKPDEDYWAQSCKEYNSIGRSFDYNASKHRCESGAGCNAINGGSLGGSGGFNGADLYGPACKPPENLDTTYPDATSAPGQRPNSGVKTCYKQDGSTVEVKSNESCPSGTTATQGGTGNFNPNTSTKECGGAQTNIISCQGSDGVSTITDILKQVLVILTTGVGVVAVGGILYGAILYASAQDNAGQTKKGIEVITNTVIGLLLYLFMFAIINLLIPGGVLT